MRAVFCDRRFCSYRGAGALRVRPVVWSWNRSASVLLVRTPRETHNRTRLRTTCLPRRCCKFNGRLSIKKAACHGHRRPAQHGSTTRQRLGRRARSAKTAVTPDTTGASNVRHQPVICNKYISRAAASWQPRASLCGLIQTDA